jgi:hypothetical protein
MVDDLGRSEVIGGIVQLKLSAGEISYDDRPTRFFLGRVDSGFEESIFAGYCAISRASD